jgi:hypothetical protein
MSSVGTEVVQLLQHTLFGRGPLGRTPQPHAGHLPRTDWLTDPPPMGGNGERSKRLTEEPS